MSKFIVERDPECPKGYAYGLNKKFLQQKGIIMPHPAPKVHRSMDKRELTAWKATIRRFSQEANRCPQKHLNSLNHLGCSKKEKKS